MHSLPEVKQAKALMTEAMAWSVVKWLREKKNVRRAADQANAALDDQNRAVKAKWSHEINAAYNELLRPADNSAMARGVRTDPRPQTISQFARQVKEADDQASFARMDAERTFDEAERLLSTSLAREGCRKAIRSWDLHEKAIRLAEAIPSAEAAS